jgi:8-oxo-dGDP phosphatase
MRLNVYVLVKRNSKFLLIKRSQTKYQRKWYLPGGCIDADEMLIPAMISRTEETTGYSIGINGVFYIHFVSRPATERGLCIFFSGRILDGKMKTTADEHSIECGWFDQKDLESIELWGNLPDLLQMAHLPLIPTSQIKIDQH